MVGASLPYLNTALEGSPTISNSPVNEPGPGQRTLDYHFVPNFSSHLRRLQMPKRLTSSATKMANSDRPVNAPALPRRNDTSHRDRRRDAPGQGTHVAQNGSARGASLRGGRTDRGTRGRGQSNHNKTTDSNGTLRASGGRLPDHSSSAMNDVVASTSTRLDRGREAQETSPSAPDNPVEDSLDGDVCFICASTIEHTSIAPCNHQTCHICSLRMRALYKTRACAHCRVGKHQ